MHDHDLKCACSWFSLFLLYIIVCPKAKKKNMIQFLWNDLKLSFGVDSISNYYKRHIDRRTIERSLRKTKEKLKNIPLPPLHLLRDCDIKYTHEKTKTKNWILILVFFFSKKKKQFQAKISPFILFFTLIFNFLGADVNCVIKTCVQFYKKISVTWQENWTDYAKDFTIFSFHSSC
jgi:hypothetical protein